MQCYTCGQTGGTHHPYCPDHRRWRRLMPWLSDVEYDRLIPVGTWYTDQGGRV